MMSFEDEKNGRRTAETPEAAPLKAEALTDIDDDLISDAMEKIEKDTAKRRFPWLAAAAALALLIAGGLIAAKLLKPNGMQQDAMAETPIPTESAMGEQSAPPTDAPDLPPNPVPSYSEWESQLPSATDAPYGFSSIDELAERIQGGDEYLIEKIDRVYMPADLPEEADFRCLTFNGSCTAVEYALGESGEALVLLFRAGWSDFDIEQYLNADGRGFIERNGVYITEINAGGYDDGMRNAYWTREEGLFLLRVPQSYSEERILSLTELDCVLLPNAYPSFRPDQVFVFKSEAEFLEELRTGGHSDDELGTLDRYYLLADPPEDKSISVISVEKAVVLIDYYKNDVDRLLLNWHREKTPEELETMISEELERSYFQEPPTVRRLADNIALIEGYNNGVYAFFTEDGCVFSLFCYGCASDQELIRYCSVIRCELPDGI